MYRAILPNNKRTRLYDRNSIQQLYKSGKLPAGSRIFYESTGEEVEIEEFFRDLSPKPYVFISYKSEEVYYAESLYLLNR